MNTDEELEKLIAYKSSYANDEPCSFWREKHGTGVFYASKVGS